MDMVYDLLGSQPFSAEFKYDGQRAQIHANRRSSGSHLVKIFSRHLEDMTDKVSSILRYLCIQGPDIPDDGRLKYPDVVSLVDDMFANYTQVDSFILDAEIVAIDPTDGSLRSFQELSNRARRDVKLDEVKISVAVFAFDLMYLNNDVSIVIHLASGP